MFSLNYLRICNLLTFSAIILSAAHLLAAQEGDEMKANAITAYVSANDATTKVSGIACISLHAAADSKRLDPTRGSTIVLQQVHALENAAGPFAVYLESAGAKRPSEANRIGYFSLYSFQQREDGQDLSFDVPSGLLRRLMNSQHGLADLQVCVEDRNPSLSGNTGPSVVLNKVLLVQLKPR